jgi:glycosyltransferase involved in cell wall biosynthesis
MGELRPATTEVVGPAVSVVIPTLDRRRLLRHQLDALARQRTTVPFEVVIADNGCGERTFATVRSFEAGLDVRVIDARRQRGVSYARNEGARAARAAVLLFLDDDDVVAPDYVSTMAQALERHPIVNARIDVMGPPSEATSRRYGSPDKSGSTVVQACAFGIRTDVFHQLGGFDERGAAGAEEIELAHRIAQSGLAVAYEPRAVLHYRLRLRGTQALGKARRATFSIESLARPVPGLAPERVSAARWLRYAGGSFLRAVGCRDPQRRHEGWIGMGIVLGKGEALVRLSAVPTVVGFLARQCGNGTRQGEQG